MTSFKIGQAAKAADVGIETIRFYERRGLIDRPAKPDGGARQYDHEMVRRIRFVRQAQTIGFSLKEIAELLSLRTDPDADCADVRARAIVKREEVEARLAHLVQIRGALDGLIARCPGGGGVEACSILEAMNENTRRLRTQPRGRDAPKRTETEDMKTTMFTIDGMHCDGCAHTIEALLLRVPGVRKADMSFAERRARVLHDPAAASVDDLTAAVSKGGFIAKAARE